MKIKYPRLISLAIAISLAYVVFSNATVRAMLSGLGKYNYPGVFIGGLLFAFGFSSPIAVLIFLILKPDNLIIAAAVGGLGSMLGDIFIITVVKKGYREEFKKLRKTKTAKVLLQDLEIVKAAWLRKTITYLVLAIIIITPIPDEIGISLFAGFVELKISEFAMFSFLLHATAIFLLLLIP